MGDGKEEEKNAAGSAAAKEDKRIYILSEEKPAKAFGITLVRQLILYVPLLLILNRLFGFGGMIWAQPVTEVIMMAVSIGLLYFVIRGQEMREG